MALSNSIAEVEGVIEARRPSVFFVAMSVVLLVLVAAGFAPTFFLRSMFGTIDPALGTPQMPWHLYLHGTVLTAWFVLLIVQPVLVAAGRTDLHRWLGAFGAVLAVLVIVVSVWTVTKSFPRNLVAGVDLVGRRANLFGNTATLLAFGVCVAKGLSCRNQPDAHKRLMLLGSIAIIAQATQRIGFLVNFAPLGIFGVLALLIVVLAHDLWSRRRVHWATVWGGTALIACNVLFVAIARSPIGMAIMNSVYGGAAA